MKSLISVILLVLLGWSDGTAKVAIIVNKSVKLTTADQKTIVAIYMLRTSRWPNGSRITLFNLKSKSDGKNKFYSFLEKTSFELRKNWMRLHLTGEAKPPVALKSEEEMLDKVAKTPGAIGFISSEKVDDSVRILLTIN